jgi:hypothetical protein
MASKKSSAKSPLDELEDDIPTEAQMQVDDFFDEIEPNVAYIEIYRVRDDGRRPNCGRVTLDILRTDYAGYLRDKYGAGRYLMMGKDVKNSFLRSKMVDVEAERTPTPNGNGHGTGSERELMLALISTLRPPPPVDIGSLLQGLAAMKPAAPPPPPDPTQMFTAILTAVTAVKGTDDGMERLQKMMALVKDMLPEGKQEENVYTVVKDVGTKLVNAFTQPRGPAEPQPVPSIEPQPQPAAILPPSALTEETLQRWIVTQLTFLKDKARQDKDPGVFADYILDNGDEPGCAALVVAMQRGVTFDMLCEFDADIKTNPQLNLWFKRLYDELHSELFAPVDTAGGAGDVGHAPPNADPGASSDVPGATAGATTRKPRKRQ